MSARRPLRPIAAALAGWIAVSAPAFATERVATTSRVAAMSSGPARAIAAADAARPAPEAPGERVRLTVTVDRAKVIRLPEATKTVIVGNPSIADVAIQKSGIVVLTGKSFGETNLIALDAAGLMLAESTLTVQAPTEAIVTVQRGLERQTYSCTPACQPAVQLGDANGFYSSTKDQAVQHGQFSGAR